MRIFLVVTALFVLLLPVRALAACGDGPDCGPCLVCTDGQCVGGPNVLCMDDDDCAGAQVCNANPDNACFNMCVAEGGCVEDAECEECQMCIGGACVGEAGVKCVSDNECGANKWCNVNAENPCMNMCLDLGACNIDQDCLECQLCVGGECLGTGLQCLDDDGCEGDKTCNIDPDDQCNNMCTTGMECEAAGDCGACQACMDGQCVDAGVILCEDDDDCKATLGTICKVDNDNPCNNQCVPYVDCFEDSDCENCEACLSGECKSKGPMECMSDNQCPPGKKCQVDAQDVCKNKCVSSGSCNVDDDCAKCELCMGGECVAAGEVMCESDDDCPEGETCDINPDDECQNACVPPAPDCEDDDDCGGCAVCLNGQCAGTGEVFCTEDEHCPGELVCHVDPEDPCKNTCAPLAPDCAVDDECGPCEACQNSMCTNIGEVLCTSDDDCGGNEVCGNAPDNPCIVTCVEAVPEVDVTIGEEDIQAQPEDIAAKDIGGNGGGDGDGGGDSGGCSFAATGSPLAVWLLVLALLAALMRRRSILSS